MTLQKDLRGSEPKMKTKDIIQENLRESDQLMLKIFRTIPLFIMADVLFILILKIVLHII